MMGELIGRVMVCKASAVPPQLVNCATMCFSDAMAERRADEPLVYGLRVQIIIGYSVVSDGSSMYSISTISLAAIRPVPMLTKRPSSSFA